MRPVTSRPVDPGSSVPPFEQLRVQIASRAADGVVVTEDRLGLSLPKATRLVEDAWGVGGHQ